MTEEEGGTRRLQSSQPKEGRCYYTGSELGKTMDSIDWLQQQDTEAWRALIRQLRRELSSALPSATIATVGTPRGSASSLTGTAPETCTLRKEQRLALTNSSGIKRKCRDILEKLCPHQGS